MASPPWRSQIDNHNQKIERLVAVDGKRVSLSVGDGLTIRVHPSGRKSWVFRLYRDGRVIDETIGHWPEMSLKHARQAVREKRKRAALEPPAGFTLRDAFRLWCAVKKKSISSYSEERRRIERHVMSALGRRQIDEITAPLVIAHLKTLESEGKQATLKRLLMRTREIMSFAVCAGYVKHNPLEDVSRVFSPPKLRPCLRSIGANSIPRAALSSVRPTGCACSSSSLRARCSVRARTPPCVGPGSKAT